MAISKLEAFLVERSNAQKCVDIELNGEYYGYVFKVKSLSVRDMTEAKNRAFSGKSLDQRSDIDLTVQNIIEGCVEPNFKSQEFIESLGYKTPEQAVESMPGGLIAALSKEILNVSGFNVSLKERVEEAKN
jgi:hypothetical protein